MDMADLTRGERLQIMLTGEELQAVDDWRFTRRMPSRAAAVRELLRRGLEAEGFSTAVAGRRSESFGVIEEQLDVSTTDGSGETQASGGFKTA
jgi:hypothetical protein